VLVPLGGCVAKKRLHRTVEAVPDVACQTALPSRG
jgi:hypothetical protein